ADDGRVAQRRRAARTGERDRAHDGERAEPEETNTRLHGASDATGAAAAGSGGATSWSRVSRPATIDVPPRPPPAPAPNSRLPASGTTTCPSRTDARGKS